MPTHNMNMCKLHYLLDYNSLSTLLLTAMPIFPQSVLYVYSVAWQQSRWALD